MAPTNCCRRSTRPSAPSPVPVVGGGWQGGRRPCRRCRCRPLHLRCPTGGRGWFQPVLEMPPLLAVAWLAGGIYLRARSPAPALVSLPNLVRFLFNPKVKPWCSCMHAMYYSHNGTTLHYLDRYNINIKILMNLMILIWYNRY